MEWHGPDLPRVPAVRRARRGARPEVLPRQDYGGTGRLCAVPQAQHSPGGGGGQGQQPRPGRRHAPGDQLRRAARGAVQLFIQRRRVCVPRRDHGHRHAGTDHCAGRVPQPGRAVAALLHLEGLDAGGRTHRRLLLLTQQDAPLLPDQCHQPHGRGHSRGARPGAAVQRRHRREAAFWIRPMGRRLQDRRS